VGFAACIQLKLDSALPVVRKFLVVSAVNFWFCFVMCSYHVFDTWDTLELFGLRQNLIQNDHEIHSLLHCRNGKMLRAAQNPD